MGLKVSSGSSWVCPVLGVIVVLIKLNFYGNNLLEESVFKL